MVQEINQTQFNEVTAQGLSIVDFWAPWCGPCRMQGPILEDLQTEVGDKATIYKVNVDENPELAGQFEIMSIPTLLLIKDGQLVDKMVGLQMKEALVDKLAKA